MTAQGWSLAGADDWRALVERTLRGRDLAELSSRTRDGIEVRPLYTAGPERPAALAAADLHRCEAGWDVRQLHRLAASGGAAEELRRRIQEDLAGGVASVELEVPVGIDADELDALLDGVDIAATPVALAPSAEPGAAETLLALAARRGAGLASGSSLGVDPLGEWARSGRRMDCAPAAAWAASLAASPVGRSFQGSDPGVRGAQPGDDFDLSGGLFSDPGVRGAQGCHHHLTADVGSDPVVRGAQGSGLGVRGAQGAWPQSSHMFRHGSGVGVFTVDALRYADAGATEAQVLGWATATGVAYLRALVEAGVQVDAAAGMIGFRLAATVDQFVTIAALRAARVIWARVVTAGGGSQQAARQYQHAVTAPHMFSRRDPWVNLLRGAAAALAAGVAGADAVTVLPFDHASGAVDADGALGRRLARNTQLLLLEESHLGRAADPAGGSFYVESLTEQLASAGWRVLQDVEASGGIGAVVRDGAIAAAVDGSWRSRLGSLRTRSEPVTGVSEFPSLDEPASVSVVGPVEADRTGADCQHGRSLASVSVVGPVEADRTGADCQHGRSLASVSVVGPVEADDGAGLLVRRLAEPFEVLRDAADRWRVATVDRPAVWVAALGPAATHAARTAWVQNLLAAGGVEARGATGADSPIAAAAGFAASGLTAAVITGSDDVFRLRGAAAAAALSDAGAAFVALACDLDTPAELLAELRSAGVEEVWHDGIDAVAALERLHRILGIG